MIDIIFKNAKIIDGTGKKAYYGDLGVSDGLFVTDPSGEARKEYDLTGKCVCPGFIDSHSHMDRALGRALDAIAVESRVKQGVTTEMTGMCGASLFPVEDTESFFRFAEKAPKAVNYGFMVGHGSVRTAVMQYRSGPPDRDELRAMSDHVRFAMEKGCFGLSSGLIYIPGVYADTQELIDLAKEISPYGGIYATHLRSEADRLVEAVSEAILIAREAKVPLFISHHKAMGVSNWGKSKQTLRLVHDAAAQGLKITIDQYPYTASQSSLMNSIPPEYFTEGKAAFAKKLKDPALREELKKRMTAPEPGYNSGLRNAGGFDRVMIASLPKTPGLSGITIADYAKRKGMDPFECYFDLLAENECEGYGIFFAMDEEDMERIYLDENTCVGSDATFGSIDEHNHPRSYASFVRSICYFHKDRGLVTLEEAIRKQTFFTAQRWGLKGKGRIAGGYDADFVIFDEKKLRDRADFAHPRRTAEGIEAVCVAGRAVCINGIVTGERPGKCLYRKDPVCQG